MAYIERGPRVGRSQGASIFWGLVSVFFAAAACFYFWKSLENERSANKLRDEVLHLQEDNDKLNAEKEKLQASMSDSAGQLKTREEFLNEKEAKLAAQEARMEALGLKSPTAPAPAQATVKVPKPFMDAVHKLDQTDGVDTTTRSGRPVLRVPNASLFAPGDATLKPDGQALLNQIAQSLNGLSDNFVLRIETFTDTGAEASVTDASSTKGDDKKDGSAKPEASAKPDAAAKPHFANGWELTAARAGAIERYFCDQSSLTFSNVLVVARGDTQPVSTGGKDPVRDRRVEISLTPVPAPFKNLDMSPSTNGAPVNPLTPPPDAPASSNKDKPKDKDKAK